MIAERYGLLRVSRRLRKVPWAPPPLVSSAASASGKVAPPSTSEPNRPSPRLYGASTLYFLDCMCHCRNLPENRCSSHARSALSPAHASPSGTWVGGTSHKWKQDPASDVTSKRRSIACWRTTTALPKAVFRSDDTLLEWPDQAGPPPGRREQNQARYSDGTPAISRVLHQRGSPILLEPTRRERRRAR